MSEPVVMICMRIADGPALAAFTGFCMACKEVVGLSVASHEQLNRLVIQYGGPKHLLCGHCYVKAVNEFGIEGQQLQPLSMAQLLEVAEELRRQSEEDNKKEGEQ